MVTSNMAPNMALPPPEIVGDGAQRQKMTTALRNICRDYPGGGGVFRELLQNADDAGATNVRFVLDVEQHPIDQLMHQELRQYQGPALLAYNDAVFTAKDFESLSRVGDSLKLDDGSTTGKFGRGFNSVYNWTDSPSIVSRDRYLILDPHEEWSTGGPIYNFVASSKHPAIMNHMQAFKAILNHTDRPFDGTILRIPFRTREQASKSDISETVTTASAIWKVMQDFAADFGENGLLFMRNVQKLEFVLGDNLIVIEMTGESLRKHKMEVKTAVGRAFKTPGFKFDYSFRTGIRVQSAGTITTTEYLVQHSINGAAIPGHLRDWARKQYLVPWVALAAQIPIEGNEIAAGKLFTVLPLPMSSHQPVHLHALFSLSPDRARLHDSDDKSNQDQYPGKWNAWLFHDAVPYAWSQLLCSLSLSYPMQSAFKKWPWLLESGTGSLKVSTDQMIRVIKEGSLAVWPTTVGYVSAAGGLLSSGSEFTALKDALQELGAPVVYIPGNFRSLVEPVFKGRTLTPRNLCLFMKANKGAIGNLSENTKHKIVEYVLQQSGFTGYDGLEIFPYEDGTYRSIGDSVSYVHRDDFEKTLFDREMSQNLALDKLSATAQRSLKDGCNSLSLHPMIRYRTATSLRTYCMQSVFSTASKDRDNIKLEADDSELVLKVWKWIFDRSLSLTDSAISSLWLLPLSNGLHRKVQSRHADFVTYFAPAGEVGDLVRDLDTQLFTRPLPLLKTTGMGEGALSARFVSALTKSPQVMTALSIVDAGSVSGFFRWIQHTAGVVPDLPGKEKSRIGRGIRTQLAKSATPADFSGAYKVVRDLEIFEKVTWDTTEAKSKLKLTWTTLASCKKSVGLLDGLSAVPDIDGVQFLSAKYTDPCREIARFLQIFDSLDSKDIIERYVIPAWEDGQSQAWTSSTKEQVAAFMLGKYAELSLIAQKKLEVLSIVPVMQLNGKDTDTFACVSELIDPTASELKDLCFDDEEILPSQEFWAKYEVALKGLGVKTHLDETVIGHRIICYASNKYTPLEVQQRAQMLLQSACRWTSSLKQQENSNLQRLAWLPIVDTSGALILKSAQECRSMKDMLLVGSQLPILPFEITLMWIARLGWQRTISGSVLLAQLRFGIESKDRDIVDAVLEYISERKLTDSLVSELRDISCVNIGDDLFVKPTQAIQPHLSSYSCSGLRPYVGNVDSKFWRDHRSLLVKIKTKEKLELSDILALQNTLSAKTTLDDDDVAVSIESLKLAARFPGSSSSLKIISDSRKLCSFQDIVFNDLGALRPKANVEVSHSDIPRWTIEALKIESLSERNMKGMLDIEDGDEDDDDYDQQENATTRMLDTLERYAIESTFREYLANAEDAQKASKISWLLDERHHPCEKLINPQMSKLQGPSLLVHNNGVFSKDDFNGFKAVGEGSKSENKASIGQFGRGSQTMFHWTDNPMILSGSYLVILDPLQEILPLNLAKGKRKAGMKVLLSKLREACPGHLVPFEGLFGYDSKQDEFKGTIFRFPLLTSTAKSSLKRSEKDLSSPAVCRLMDTYFAEARISLLFLRRITSIEFAIHGKLGSGWSVKKRMLQDEANISFTSIACSFVKSTALGTQVIGEDEWWIAIEPVHRNRKMPVASSRKTQKNPECGFAALTASNFEDETHKELVPDVSKSRMFNRLPLSLFSDLPVHIHATFSLSGDRQSIILDGYGTLDPRSIANMYLLKDAIPGGYLRFLANMAVELGHRTFQYWPQRKPPPDTYAAHVYEGFWTTLQTSDLQLFPKSQLVQISQEHTSEELLDISEAVFDFKYSTEVLAPLLLALDVNLVRDVPALVAMELESLSQTTTIDENMVRDLLKTDKGRRCLQKQMVTTPDVWDVLFRFIMPPSDGLTSLDGCHILPLADGNLGTLRLLSPGFSPAKYYIVSTEELALFSFASARLIRSGNTVKLRPLAKIFNIQELSFHDIRHLVEMRPAVTQPDILNDQWLAKFWTYWNNKPGSREAWPVIKESHTALYRATCNGTVSYITPVQFDRLPAVVESSVAAQIKLCSQIPGFYRVDAKLIPSVLFDDEKWLTKELSFYRFVHALSRLAGSTTIGAFVQQHIEPASLMVFRTLVITYVVLKRVATEFSGTMGVLKFIPLWPRLKVLSSQPLISVSDAFIAANPTLLVPWMKEAHKFIDPAYLSDLSERGAACLAILGVSSPTPDSILRHYVLPLPQNIYNTYWQEYRDLMASVFVILSSAGHNLHPYLQARLAVDGNGVLKLASQLYDHSDDMFKAAFKHEVKARFVHKGLQLPNLNWRKVGLRHAAFGVISAGDFVECLKIIANRISARSTSVDFDLTEDIKAVLRPLITPSNSLQSCGPADWVTICAQKVFEARTNFNGDSDYRRAQMRITAAGQPVLSLSEIVSDAHISICWSQTAFPWNIPTTDAFSHCASKGKPTVDIVWRHLQHLKDIAPRLLSTQIRDFLEDLKATYQYLQDNLVASRAGFKLRGEALWLNLDAWDHHSVLLQDVKSAWHAIDNLVLSSSCDAGRIKAVRPGLMLFEKLLRVLDCSSITYPTVTRPPIQSGFSILNSLRDLRRKGEMTDVTYTSQGHSVKAHKVVLAALSKQCAALFSGQYKHEILIATDDDPDTFLSFHTLDYMVNYAYEEPLNWTGMEVNVKTDDEDVKAEKLEKLLNLCKGADYWDIITLKSAAEDRLLAAHKEFINLENVLDLMARSEAATAHAFHALCGKFEEQNRDAVKRAHAEMEE